MRCCWKSRDRTFALVTIVYLVLSLAGARAHWGRGSLAQGVIVVSIGH